MKNYLKIEKLSLLYDYLCYVDTDEYLADSIFEQYGAKVEFLEEAEKT